MTPKAFDFGEDPEPVPDPAQPAAVPRPFDFGATPEPTAPPRALSFDDFPEAPASAGLVAKAPARALFESEDHPAVRDALAIVRADHPDVFAQAEQRLAALFRRILPVKLVLVTQWADEALEEQAGLLEPVTGLVLKFTELGVPALLDAALESARAPAGMFDKLFRRQASPAEYKQALAASRAQLLQLMADSEAAVRKLEASAQDLNLHGLVLATVSTLAAGASEVTRDALVQRRALIGQAVRQAELSMLQLEQVRRQAADLIGQISSFLTVTLPALELAQGQGGN